MKELTELQEILHHQEKVKKLNVSGFAGILSNGNIADRRRHLKAIPVQANSMFGVVMPKEVTTLEILNDFLPKAYDKLISLGLEHSQHAKLCDILNELKQEYTSNPL